MKNQTNSPQHIIQWGGGVTSWATAHVIAKRHGIENLVLLFADTKAEHPDLYRFNDEASALVGVPITRVCDGRTPIEANRDRKFLGNSRLAPCSKILKQDPCRAWLEENSDPETDMLYVGIDVSELHRIPGVRKGWAPWRVEFPLTEPPLRDKRGWIEEVRRLKVREPEMYRLGYSHNNCFGGCVRGGVAYWAHTLKTFPEVFAEHEQAESAFRTDGGDTATYLTVTRDGVERSLPLIQLRQRIESADSDAPALFDPYDWGGCGCFIAEDDEATT